MTRATQVRIATESDAVGAYSFRALTPAFYELSAEAGGFRKITVANIEVNIGVTIRQNLKMELGTVTDTILVESSSVRVQTSEATIPASHHPPGHRHSAPTGP